MKPVDEAPNNTNNAPPGSLADMVNKVGNSNVNYIGKSMGAKGGAKSTSMDKDLGKKATNSMGKIGHKENGPSATCAGSGYGQRGKKG